MFPQVRWLLQCLLGDYCQGANQRLWDTLYGLLRSGQRAVLDSLQTVPPGDLVSELDRLRRGPVRISDPQMKWALERAEEITNLRMGEVDVSAIPPRRLAELSGYGVDGKASLLAPSWLGRPLDHGSGGAALIPDHGWSGRKGAG